MRTLLLVLTVMTLFLTIGLASVPSSATSSMPDGKLLVENTLTPPAQWNFTIYVGITGFNSTYKDGITLSVNQGDQVTIWFIYNDTGINNPHDIQIQGYGLSTGTIDQSNPVKSLSFTANIPGPTSFVCIDVDCEGHANLQAGVLDVKPSTGAEWIKTTLHLSGQVQARSRPVILLIAHMIDVNGSVVPGVLLHFYRNSTWGFAEIGVGVTNSSGLTALAYFPPADGYIVFQVIFMGSGAYLPSNSDSQTVHYASPGGSQPGFPYVWGQNPLFDLRIVGVPGLTGLFWVGVAFVVVSSVWATYLFVFRQVVGIWKDGSGRPRQSSTSYQAPMLGPNKPPLPASAVSNPIALLIGLGMMALGYADFLLLTILVPGTVLVLLPALGLAEALILSRLLRPLH